MAGRRGALRGRGVVSGPTRWGWGPAGGSGAAETLIPHLAWQWCMLRPPRRVSLVPEGPSRGGSAAHRDGVKEGGGIFRTQVRWRWKEKLRILPEKKRSLLVFNLSHLFKLYNLGQSSSFQLLAKRKISRFDISKQKRLDLNFFFNQIMSFK